ncbi:MAG TPA: hypothetical protein VE781_10570 [Kineosporiaceae bacterium]|nr:hypothetical protein [Kineosporiaceae bacterium]
MATRTATRTRPAAAVRCTYCGGRGDGLLLELDLRGVRYDYCDAACATAHRQAVELTAALCSDCDDDALGDGGACAEHLEPSEQAEPAAGWRRAG